jgi:hypothetical protein
MTDRRSFITAMAALSAGATLGGTAEVSAAALPASDAWLDQLKGKHRQLFDAPDPDGGTVLRHVRNYLDGWRDDYGVGERDVSVIVTLYGRTTPLGLQDSMWVKYQLGGTANLNITDPTTNAPLARNWFAHPKPGDAVADGTPESSIESLRRRGVVFALCNNALKRWSGRLEKQGLGTTAEIHADLTAHALPEVVIVPDVLIAMTKAHERGFGSVRS